MQEIGELPGCTHVYCFPCISRWAESENRCPTCRETFGAISRKRLAPDSGHEELAPGKRLKGEVLETLTVEDKRQAGGRKVLGCVAPEAAAAAAGAACTDHVVCRWEVDLTRSALQTIEPSLMHLRMRAPLSCSVTALMTCWVWIWTTYVVRCVAQVRAAAAELCAHLRQTLAASINHGLPVPLLWRLCLQARMRTA